MNGAVKAIDVQLPTLESAANPGRARLRWLCRRGMRELDVLCSRYLDERYDLAPAEEQAAFARMLSCEDPDLWDWSMGRSSAPLEFKDVIERFQRKP